MRGPPLKYIDRRKTYECRTHEYGECNRKIEGSKEARPPGGFPLASAPKKIFICSPYRPTANDPPCRKAQMEANIQRAKTACRILATMGVLPLVRICILLSS